MKTLLPALLLPSLALILAAVTARADAPRSPAVVLRDAANAFLAALDDEQKGRAAFGFGDTERENWHFVPRERKGLPLKAMTESQRDTARKLLQAGLSARGYLKVNTIIALENVLKEIEKGSGPVRDDALYYFSIFGTPSDRGPWGWRVEGHHLSINFTLVSGKIAATPTFFGANPAEVRSGPMQGTRALKDEEEMGRALLTMLDPGQRKTAIFSEVAPADIVTGNAKQVDPLSPAGLTYAQMTEGQRRALWRLIDVYLGAMPAVIARERRERIRRAGVEKIAFAWAGGDERGQKHYYRVQGPTFLIEYDNTQNDANHIHAVWREFTGDFGRDLLREHVHRDHKGGNTHD